MERSIHDALCVVKRVLESDSVVCGGGAVEAALSVYLENFASSLVRRLALDDAHWSYQLYYSRVQENNWQLVLLPNLYLSSLIRCR